MKMINGLAAVLSISLAFSGASSHAAPGASLVDMLSSAVPAKAPKEENERPKAETQSQNTSAAATAGDCPLDGRSESKLKEDIAGRECLVDLFQRHLDNPGNWRNGDGTIEVDYSGSGCPMVGRFMDKRQLSSNVSRFQTEVEKLKGNLAAVQSGKCDNMEIDPFQGAWTRYLGYATLEIRGDEARICWIRNKQEWQGRYDKAGKRIVMSVAGQQVPMKLSLHNDDGEYMATKVDGINTGTNMDKIAASSWDRLATYSCQ